MGKFRKFLSELPACDRSLFSFPDDNFCKYQRIFTKLNVCIDIMEFCFDRQVLSVFDRVICPDMSFFFFFIFGQ